MTKITSFGAIFNILINLIIIPIWTFIVASISTVLTEYLIFIVFTIYISKTKFHLEKRLIITVLKLLFASFVMVIILHFIKLNIIATVLIGAIIYGILILLIKVLDEKDLQMIKELVNK